MKRLEISKLMDEYTDTEVFPAGGSSVNPEAVKGWVLASARPTKEKKQMSRKKKMLIAATLAAVLVLLVGAGFPYVQHRLVSGDLIFQQTADSWTISLAHYGPVMELEDGRLFFNPEEGARMDVTDFINENTPYIYDAGNPNENMTYYIIMGGTPENYGYLEWIRTPDPIDYGDGPQPPAVLDENGRRMAINYAFTSVTYDTGERYCAGISGSFDIVQLEPVMDRPWLLAGLNELGIPYEYAPPENLG